MLNKNLLVILENELNFKNRIPSLLKFLVDYMLLLNKKDIPKLCKWLKNKGYNMKRKSDYIIYKREND